MTRDEGRSSLSPYTLPDGKIHIAFSGGRTSGYMLHQIIEVNGGIPEDRCEVTFQNTGREMPQTLDFVREIGERWQVPITWLEYRPIAPHFEIVGYQGASRNGEPFEALIRKRKYLPNQAQRFCTEELKVRTAKRYLRSIGWDYWTSCVGIRADEPHRFKPEGVKLGDRWRVWQPLVRAAVTKEVVADFWKGQPFDLALPNVRGNCWLGNCDGCFLKSEASIAALTREHPERAAWWEEMEDAVTGVTSSPDGAKFSKRYSRREMREFVERQGDWIFDDEAYLCQKDDGECLV